jgi:hypothetical protein
LTQPDEDEDVIDCDKTTYHEPPENIGDKTVYPKDFEKGKMRSNPITAVTKNPRVESRTRQSPRRGAIKISPRKNEDENELRYSRTDTVLISTPIRRATTERSRSSEGRVKLKWSSSSEDEDKNGTAVKFESSSMSTPPRMTSIDRFKVLEGVKFRKKVEADSTRNLPVSRFRSSEITGQEDGPDEAIPGVRPSSSLEKAILNKRRSDETTTTTESPRNSSDRLLDSNSDKSDGKWPWRNISSSFKIQREGLRTSTESDTMEEPTDTLLLRAIQHGSVEQMMVVLMFGAAIHPYAIHAICSNVVTGAAEKLKVLLDNGGVIYINTHDQYNFTPLHYLLQRMNFELQYCLPLLEILSGHGVDANMQDRFGIPAVFFFLDRVYKSCPEGNLVLRHLLKSIDPYQTFESNIPILEYCRKLSDHQTPSIKFQLAQKILEEAQEGYKMGPLRIPEYPYYGACLSFLD